MRSDRHASAALARLVAFKGVLEWLATGRPVPVPHYVKRATVFWHGRSHRLRTLVETGTYHGDMVAAMRRHFKSIVSIELDSTLHRQACERFDAVDNVELIQADSGEQLTTVVERLDEPALFWLDGHYSGGVTARGDQATPIRKELATVFATSHNHVVLIDDARMFGRAPDYPPIEEIEAQVKRVRPEYNVDVRSDIIRICPPQRRRVLSAVRDLRRAIRGQGRHHPEDR